MIPRYRFLAERLRSELRMLERVVERVEGAFAFGRISGVSACCAQCVHLASGQSG